MLGYTFKVVYKPRLENKVVDASSRMPPTMHLYRLTAPTLLDLIVIKEEVEKDARLMEIIAELQKEKGEVTDFSLQQGMLRYKGRLAVSKSSTMIPTILHTYLF